MSPPCARWPKSASRWYREYKGSHSGEHGDGLARSEFHEAMFGPRIVRAFETVKDAFDPGNMLNPGRIVRAPRMDDRRLLRYHWGYAPAPGFTPKLDWSEHPGPLGGMLGAVEMCNNNGTCRAFDAGVMCPSYRVTRDETHLTRGRANTLRLALYRLVPMRWHLTPWPKRCRSACRARRVGGNAPPASTWQK